MLIVALSKKCPKLKLFFMADNKVSLSIKATKTLKRFKKMEEIEFPNEMTTEAISKLPEVLSSMPGLNKLEIHGFKDGESIKDVFNIVQTPCIKNLKILIINTSKVDFDAIFCRYLIQMMQNKTCLDILNIENKEFYFRFNTLPNTNGMKCLSISKCRLDSETFWQLSECSQILQLECQNSEICENVIQVMSKTVEQIIINLCEFTKDRTKQDTHETHSSDSKLRKCEIIASELTEQATEEMAVDIQVFEHLEYLTIDECDVENDCVFNDFVAALANNTNLKSLSLANNKTTLTSHSIENMKNLQNLQQLVLSRINSDTDSEEQYATVSEDGLKRHWKTLSQK